MSSNAAVKHSGPVHFGNLMTLLHHVIPHCGRRFSTSELEES